MNNDVYDKEDELAKHDQELRASELRALTGIDEEEEKAIENSAQAGAARDIAKKEKQKNEPGKNSEKESIENIVSSNRSGRFGLSFMRKHSKALGVGGVAGLIVGGGISIFTLIMPVKLMTIMNNTTEKISSIPMNAVEQRMDTMISYYLYRKAFNITEGTQDVFVGKSMWGTISGNRRADKFLDKLKTEHGIEFRSVGRRGNDIVGWEIVDSTTGKTMAVSDTSGWNADVLLSNKEARSFIEEAVDNEIPRHRIIKRWHTRKLLKNKFGVKEWRFAEEKRDNVKSRYVQAKRSIYKAMVQRTVGPVSERYSQFFSCLIEGEDKCKDLLKQKDTPDADANGEADDPSDNPSSTDPDDTKKLEQANADVARGKDANATKAGAESAVDVMDNSTDEIVESTNFSDEIGKLISKEASKQLIKSVGTGIAVLEFIRKVDDAVQNGNFSKVMYAAKSIQSANFNSNYQTLLSQNTAGKLSADFVNIAMIQIAGLEKSPAYQEKFGTLDYDETKTYRQDCDPDTPGEQNPDEGELVCEQRKLIVDNEAVIRDNSFYQPIHLIAEVYRNSVGVVVGFINNIIDAVTEATIGPLLNGILQSTGASELIQDVIDRLMSSILGVTYTGTEKDVAAYDGIASGLVTQYSSLGMESVNGIGGSLLSENEQAKIYEEEKESNRIKLSKMSLIARISSINEPGTVANKMLTSAPTSYGQLANSLSSLGGNILGNIGRSFAYIFGGRALAASQGPSLYSIYGAPAYGYSSDDPDLKLSPDEFENKHHCTDPNKQPVDREVKKVEGIPFPVPTKQDYCAIEKVSKETFETWFTDEDDANLEGVQEAPATPASEVLTDPSGYYRESYEVPCPAGLIDGGPQDGYHKGNLIKIRVCGIPGQSHMVNVLIADKVDRMFKDAAAQGINLSIRSGFRTMASQQALYASKGSGKAARPGFSNHQMGLALDLGLAGDNAFCYSTHTSISGYSKSSPHTCPNNAGWQWMQSNATKYDLKAFYGEAWHWSVTGG